MRGNTNFGASTSPTVTQVVQNRTGSYLLAGITPLKAGRKGRESFSYAQEFGDLSFLLVDSVLSPPHGDFSLGFVFLASVRIESLIAAAARSSVDLDSFKTENYLRSACFTLTNTRHASHQVSRFRRRSST